MRLEMLQDNCRRFQDLIFQELEKRKRIATQEAVHQFINLAAERGFPIDQLIGMTGSGMPGADVWRAVFGSSDLA